MARDEIKAYQWFDLAARAGDSEAEKALADVAGTMTPEQIGEARQHVRDWQATEGKLQPTDPGGPEEL